MTLAAWSGFQCVKNVSFKAHSPHAIHVSASVALGVEVLEAVVAVASERPLSRAEQEHPRLQQLLL